MCVRDSEKEKKRDRDRETERKRKKEVMGVGLGEMRLAKYCLCVAEVTKRYIDHHNFGFAIAACPRIHPGLGLALATAASTYPLVAI